MNEVESKLHIMCDNAYIGPSQFYKNITRIKKYVKTPVDIYSNYDSADGGPGGTYMLNLVYDYETYVDDFGFIPIEEFIKGWTVICPEDYPKIKESDTLYICNGNHLGLSLRPVMEETFFRDEDNRYQVGTLHYDKAGNAVSGTDEIFFEGDLYYIPFIHIDYLTKVPNHSKEKKGGLLCPILITRTKKQSNLRTNLSKSFP